MVNNILVIGGTGKTGRKVVQGLRERSQNVRIGSRSMQPAFEWTDPSSWPAALAGMDMVYIVFSPDLAVPGAYEAVKGLLEAAKKASVKKVVLLSGKGETEAERCERLVVNAGLDYTIVRASWFSQNFSESFLLAPILAGKVAMPLSTAKIPFVDTGDIAEVVVETLLDAQHNGQTYELTGPRSLTFPECIAEISREIGEDIPFQPISLAEYNEMMKAAGVPEDYAWLIDYLFREVLTKEENQHITYDVKKVLGREATDFSEYVRHTAATGVWKARA